eukprot:6492108-Amphidinium_carterae.2
MDSATPRKGIARAGMLSMTGLAWKFSSVLLAPRTKDVYSAQQLRNCCGSFQDKAVLGVYASAAENSAVMAAQSSAPLLPGPSGPDKLSRVHVESKLQRSGVVSANVHVWSIAELTRSLWVLNDVLWVVHGHDCKEDTFVVSRIVGKQRELWTNLAGLLDVDVDAGLYDSRGSVRKTGKTQAVVKQDFLASTDMLLVCLCAYICSSPSGRGALPDRAYALLVSLMQTFMGNSMNWSAVLEGCEDACASACSSSTSWCTHMQKLLGPVRSHEGHIADCMASTVKELGVGMQHCKSMQLVLAEVIVEIASLVDAELQSGRYEVDEQDLHPPNKRRKHHPNEAWKEWVTNTSMTQRRARRGTQVVRLQGLLNEPTCISSPRHQSLRLCEFLQHDFTGKSEQSPLSNVFFLRSF